MKESILNLGSGKIKPLDLPSSYFLVNVDSGYYDGNIRPLNIRCAHQRFKDIPFEGVEPSNREFFLKEDVFTFLEKYPLEFDRIVIYRFLEHVARRDVLYFIYLMSTSLKKGGVIDCIVPDYGQLARMILSEEVFSEDFEQRDIIISTELLNEVSSPHASIWTKDRIKKFFELEQRFKVGKIITPFDFDGRSIYLRALIERL